MSSITCKFAVFWSLTLREEHRFRAFQNR